MKSAFVFLSLLLVFAGETFAAVIPRERLIVDYPGAAWNRWSDRMIRREVKKVLATKPVAVTDKKRIPDSGDRHDYMSFGDYWWPNEYTTNGLPFVRKDGVVNPEAYNDSDRKRIMRLCDEVATLAAARVRLDDEAAGREGARRVRIFFLDPATAMNPNLNYAQAIPGVCKGRGIGVIDTIYLAYRFVDSVLILHAAGDLSDAELAALKRWFSTYVDWLLTSENGIAESEALNNHGTAWSLQAIVFAAFVGRDDVVRRLLAELPERRIGPQVAPNGMPTFELNRTQSFHYSTFIVDMFCLLAKLGERYGVDLWSYESAHGGSIVKAMKWMLPYLQREKAWEFEQGWPYELEQGVSALAVWKAYLRSPAARRPVRKASAWTFGRTMDEAWTDVFHSDYAGSTHLIHGLSPNFLPLPNEMAERAATADLEESSMGECVLNTSAMLLAALARWDVTRDAEAERVAKLMVDGLRLCATVSGEPGLVVEAVCVSDKKSFYPVRHFGHYTPFAFALSKAAAHPLAERNGWKADVVRLLAEAAAYCEKRGLDLPEVLAAAGRTVTAKPTADDVACGLSELVRRQMADRLLHDSEKDAARRATYRAALARRAERTLGEACPTGRLDALWASAKDDFYAPYDKDQTAVHDYVKEVGQRMVVQMLCPDRPIAERADFERRLRAIDFTKPCWYPPTAALWYYWSVERADGKGGDQ